MSVAMFVTPGVLLVRSGIATFRCVVPVVPGGDGATSAPLELRTSRCGDPTDVLVGAAPTCRRHVLDVWSLCAGNGMRCSRQSLEAWLG